MELLCFQSVLSDMSVCEDTGMSSGCAKNNVPTTDHPYRYHRSGSLEVFATATSTIVMAASHAKRYQNGGRSREEVGPT